MLVDIFKSIYQSIIDIETDTLIMYKINAFDLFSDMTLSDFNIYTSIIINKIKDMEAKAAKSTKDLVPS